MTLDEMRLLYPEIYSWNVCIQLSLFYLIKKTSYHEYDLLKMKLLN